MRLRTILLVTLLPLSGVGAAQTPRDSLISGRFTSLPFPQFARQIAQQTTWRIYYDPKVMDSLIVSITVDHQPLATVLDSIFASTDFHFGTDDQHHAFVTKGIPLQSKLSDDFFHPGERTAVANEKLLQEFLSNQKKAKSKLLAENRTYSIGRKTKVIGSGTATLSGHINASENGESLTGVTVYVENPFNAVSTDATGYFSITLPKGNHRVLFKSIGIKSTVRNIILYTDGTLDLEMQEDVRSLKEVIVESDRDKNVSGMQMGLERLDMKTMRKVPVALGEVDIFKVLLTLPGVQTVGEGTTGLNVRGGATSQNLILFNDAVIYNPSHLFGFFSAFNPEVVKSVELYKSAIPAEYGGRLSSVMDVTSREGNKKKFSGGGGIGPVTGRLVLEGPIFKDRTGFLIGGRSTYSDWLLKEIPADGLKKSKASFSDFNFNLSHEMNEKNSFYLTTYWSRDRFKLNNDTAYTYSNQAATLKWKHTLNAKLYGILTGAFSGYDYQLGTNTNPVNAFTLRYGIRQTSLKADFSCFPIPKHSVNFGVSSIHYSLSPGEYQGDSPSSKVITDTMPNEQGLESALYVGDTYDVTPALSLYGGLRFSFYDFLGPHQQFIYDAGRARDVNTITDTVYHRSGKPIAHYQGPEYRVTAKYLVAASTSLKLSYNRTRQYIQTLTNTAAVSPTDIWKLSDEYIKPQVGEQVSLGVYQNIRGNTIEASVEGYYKSLQNSLDYKSGAQLILNHHIETDVFNTKGKAYGVEVMIKKMNGKLNGWISYTYSRSLLKSAYLSDQGPNQNYYPSNYDKPNAVNLIGNYRLSHRFSTSLNATYSTGRPITLPIGRYYIDGSFRTLYGARNASRIPDYFRIDFSMNIEGNHKLKKPAHGSWTVGVYNLLARRNAYNVFFEAQNSVIKGYKLSILGTAIPTITYNFKF